MSLIDIRPNIKMLFHIGLRVFVPNAINAEVIMSTIGVKTIPNGARKCPITPFIIITPKAIEIDTLFVIEDHL
jgi:hypothetical protein